MIFLAKIQTEYVDRVLSDLQSFRNGQPVGWVKPNNENNNKIKCWVTQILIIKYRPKVFYAQPNLRNLRL